MIRKFLLLNDFPEIRPESIGKERLSPELEIIMSVDVYWQAQEIIRRMRYHRLQGGTLDRHWREFSKLIYPCIVQEKERNWYFRNYIASAR